MIQRENALDLIGSIAEQGYFAGEPFLVIPSSDFRNKFEVVEGNRRLAALKILNNPSISSLKKNAIAEITQGSIHPIPTEVEVIEFAKREEILDYLGYRHITGVDEWDSLAKARYLRQLRDSHQSKFENVYDLYKHLAKIIGSNSSYVRKLLNGFQLYLEIEDNGFYEIPNVKEENFSFSLLTTAVSYSNISDFLKISENSEGIDYDSANLKELTEWLFLRDGNAPARVPESRDLKKLNAVVANQKALEIFRKGESLEQAEIFTDNPKIAFENLVGIAYKNLKTAQSIVHTIKEFEESNSDTISDLLTLVRDLKGLIANRINAQNDIN
jgi:hypothetical protein